MRIKIIIKNPKGKEFINWYSIDPKYPKLTKYTVSNIHKCIVKSIKNKKITIKKDSEEFDIVINNDQVYILYSLSNL
jgi:hypothetical protein